MNIHAKINARGMRWRPDKYSHAIPLALLPYYLEGQRNRQPYRYAEYSPLHNGASGPCRWIEHVSHGLRVWGLAHDVCATIGHTDWHTDQHGERESLAGIIVRLPARKGCNRYLVGYADPNNDDCALLSTCVIEARREDSGELDNQDRSGLAHAADAIAESHAERDREYNDAWDELVDYRRVMNDVRLEVGQCIDALRHADRDAPEIEQLETALQDALDMYRSARDAALEAARCARRVGITWRECSP